MKLDFEMHYQDFLERFANKTPAEAWEHFKELEDYFKEEIERIESHLQKKELSV